MADFTENQITDMMKFIKNYIDPDNITRELAILELEDIKRKGCTLENIGECRGCSVSTKENSYCPLAGWEKRHPEYANDELATKIKILEAGGEAAYKFKLKAQEEAKRKAEEEAQKATDTDRVEACRNLLDLFCKSKLTTTEDGVLDLVNSILYAKTKAEIWDEVANVKKP